MGLGAATANLSPDPRGTGDVFKIQPRRLGRLRRDRPLLTRSRRDDERRRDRGSGSGALREDMISNAVAFLKHPQVWDPRRAPGRRAPITSRRCPCLEPTERSRLTHRIDRRTAPRSTRAQPAPSSQVTSSPEAQKRQFLEKKGLSAEEIDEAFKRAPRPRAPAPASPVAPPAASVSPATDDAEAESGGGLRWTQVVSRTAMAIGALGVLTRGFNRGGTAGSAGGDGCPADADASSFATPNARWRRPRRRRAQRQEAAASRARSDELAQVPGRRQGRDGTRRERTPRSPAPPPASVRALDGIKRELRDELRGVVAAAVADATASAAAATTPRGDGRSPHPGGATNDGMPESVRESSRRFARCCSRRPSERPPPGAGVPVPRRAEGAADDGADVIVPPSNHPEDGAGVVVGGGEGQKGAGRGTARRARG